MALKLMSSLSIALVLSGPAFAAPASVGALLGERRVFLVSAPSPNDPQLDAQRSALANWGDAPLDRDVTVVEIVGDHVEGARDGAAALRARFRLPNGSFATALIGNGHVALRSTKPLSSDELGGTIDAMPMRRAGQR